MTHDMTLAHTQLHVILVVQQSLGYTPTQTGSSKHRHVLCVLSLHQEGIYVVPEGGSSTFTFIHSLSDSRGGVL